MTDGRFERLLNLYLDKEIGPKELSELKREIAYNLVRKQRFERACRMHAASRKALIGQSSKSHVNTFLKKEVNVVQTQRGERTRVRRAGTSEDAEEKARALLARTVAICLVLILIAGGSAAYIIDRAAQTVRKQLSEEPLPAGITEADLRPDALPTNLSERFRMEFEQEIRQGSIAGVYVLSVDAVPPLVAPPDIDTLPPMPETGDVLSIMDLYQLDNYLKQCGYQLPGTSAPAVFCKDRSVYLVVEQGELSAR